MIYDCFTFFNELDLLEIRLNILNDTVDKFVLVEATRTHQGKSKPLYFSENRDRFRFFQHKIIHIVVDDYPTFFSKLRMPNAWDIEKHQRNAIAKGLRDCKSEDVIIVSDLDEIPDPKQVKIFKDIRGLKVFQQRDFYYYLNCVGLDSSEEWWYGSVMAHFTDFKSPQELRSVSKKMHADKMRILKDSRYRFFKSIFHSIYRKNITMIDRGGWHFGYLGGVNKIIEKLEAFAHTEYNKEIFKNKSAVQKAINNGEDLFGRGLVYSFIELDDSFPAYIIENKVRLKHLIKS